MKRLTAIIALTLALLAGGVAANTPAEAAPDRLTDYVPSVTSYNICHYGNVGILGDGWLLLDGGWRTIHYGSAHVTQCWFVSRLYYNYYTCLQYVWNVSRPGWSRYDAPCW